MNYKYNVVLDLKTTKNINPNQAVGVYMIITDCFKKQNHNDRIKISLKAKVSPIHFGLKENNFKYDEATVKKNNLKNGGLYYNISNVKRAITKTLFYFTEENVITNREDFRVKLNFNLSRITKEEHDNYFTPNSSANSEIGLTDYLKEKINEFEKSLMEKNNDSISDGRIKIYRTLCGHLKNYESYSNKRLSLVGFNKEEHNDFFYFLYRYGVGEIELKNSFLRKKPTILKNGYTQNTISKLNKALIAIINRAKDIDEIDLKLNTGNKSIKFSEAKGMKDLYLNEDQIKNILNTSVEDEDLALAKSYLVIASLMGLRFESIKYLEGKEPELKTVDNSTFYSATALLGKIGKKTYSTVPLPEILVEYLNNNHNGKFPIFNKNSKINGDIKKFLRTVDGMNIKVETNSNRFKQSNKTEKKFLCDLVSTHDCRASYISNLANLEIPRDYVKNITHPKAKTSTGAFDIYDKRNLDSKALLLAKSIQSSNTQTIYKVSFK